jgi:iron complex outermembrane receptor protein
MARITSTIRAAIPIPLLLILILASSPVRAESSSFLWPESTDNVSNLLNVPIEELTKMDYVVYSASRKAEPATETPSAVYVISQDDIRRSGVTTIAEALRMAPGVQVAQIDAHRWAISSRGFNDDFADKLLVMIDGRNVYNTLFAGVIWDNQDIMLEDIERIEIIRGPGATLWGVNAVNGVINIITKHSRDTQGGLLTATTGNHERTLGSLRYGGKVNDFTTYRMYGQYKDRQNNHFQNRTDAPDQWDIGQGGFRLDSSPSIENHYNLQGDLYHGNEQQEVSTILPAPPFLTSINDWRYLNGANLLSRWDHRLDNASTLSTTAYYSTETSAIQAGRQEVNMLNLETQHSWELGQRQQIVWGAGYRFIWDNVHGTPLFTILTNQANTNTYSLFLQDKIALIPQKLFLTLGSKIEHQPATGFEPQPSAKLYWVASNQHSFWSSFSHAARVPSRVERGAFLELPIIPGSPAPVSLLAGNSTLDSETVDAYELGYRFQPTPNVLFDSAFYYNHYRKLITFIPGTPFLQSGIPVIALTSINAFHGDTYGGEIAADWQALDRLKFRTSYSYIAMQLHADTASAAGFTSGIEGDTPHNQFNIRSYFDLTNNWELNTILYYTDIVPDRTIPAYLRFDAQINWKPLSNVELSLIGHDVFDSHHPEYKSTITPNIIEIDRSLYAKIAIKF